MTDNLGWIIILFDTMEEIEIITGVFYNIYNQGQFDHTWLLCTLPNGIAFESL